MRTDDLDWRVIHIYIGLLVQAEENKRPLLIRMAAESITAYLEICMREKEKEYAE